MVIPSYAVTLRLGDVSGNSFDEYLYLPVYMNPDNSDVHGFGLEMGFDSALEPAGGLYADDYSSYFVIDHDNSASVGSGASDGQASYIANFDIDEGLQYMTGNTEILVGYMRFEPNDDMISENPYTITILDDDENPPRYKDENGDWITIPIENTAAGSITLVDISNFYTGADESNYADTNNWQDEAVPGADEYAFIDNGSEAVNSSVPVNVGVLAIGTEQGAGGLSVIGQNVDIVDTLAVSSMSSAIDVADEMTLTGSLSVIQANSISTQSTSPDNAALLIAAPVLGELESATVIANADVEFKDITTVSLSEEVKLATATAHADSPLYQSNIVLDGSLEISEVDTFMTNGNLFASDFDASSVTMGEVVVEATSTLKVADITTLFEVNDIKLASSESLCSEQEFNGVAILENTAEFSDINRLFLDDDLNIAKTECVLGSAYIDSLVNASFKDITSFEGDDDFVIGLIQGGSHGTITKKANVSFENIESINLTGRSSDVEIASLEPDTYSSPYSESDNVISGRHWVEVIVNFKNIPSFYVGDDAYIGQISGLNENTTLNKGVYTALGDISFEQVAMDVNDRVVLGSVSLDSECVTCDETAPMPATYNLFADISLEQSYIAGGSTMNIGTTDPTIVGLMGTQLTLSNSYLYAPEVTIGENTQITFNITGATQASKDEVLTLTNGSSLIESESLTMAGHVVINATAGFDAGEYEMVLAQTTNTSVIINQNVTVEINGLEAAENVDLTFNETGDKLVLTFSVPEGEVTEPVTTTEETNEASDNSEDSNDTDGSGSSGSSGGAFNFLILLMIGGGLLFRKKALNSN
ncbi:hypothetical protein NBRC116585_20040 [Thalassolituus maritimus]|uniref:Uncharacterized protein n=2 Tax=Thalassolituus maritimus TaxID=484498 RepID=A0ABQ0A0H7_9GAMM